MHNCLLSKNLKHRSVLTHLRQNGFTELEEKSSEIQYSAENSITSHQWVKLEPTSSVSYATLSWPPRTPFTRIPPFLFDFPMSFILFIHFCNNIIPFFLLLQICFAGFSALSCLLCPFLDLWNILFLLQNFITFIIWIIFSHLFFFLFSLESEESLKGV